MTARSEQLDECLSVRDGELFIENCPASEIALRFGTPLYVISESQLRRNARLYLSEFGGRWPGDFLLLPSIKANPSLALRRILTEEGTGCDAFGFGELEAALRAETPASRISLNGPMKDEKLLERAVRSGVRITLDSRSEFDRVRRVAGRLGLRAVIRLRFRPDLVGREEPSEMSPAAVPTRRALDRYKAGIPTEDLLSITDAEVADPSIDLSGIHLHLGRHSADPEMWRVAIDSLVELLERLQRRWNGWIPRELDLGGGFPTPRDPFGRLLPQRAAAPAYSPAIEKYAEAICPYLAERLRSLGIEPEKVRFEIEPGRGLYADAGIHLATVGHVKRQTDPTPITWVETDTSDAYLPDVNLEFSRWSCVPVRASSAEPTMTADITGRSCALDVIVPDAELPAVESGDILAFLDTGAYQDAGANNFNALPRPGTVLVNDEDVEVIRRHETLDDVFRRDRIPKRLRGNGPSDGGWRALGLDHVSVSSSDLDRSLAFYVDLLGLEPRGRGVADGGEFEMTGLSDVKVRWADLQLPHGQVLELLEYTEPRGTPSRPRPNDPGATHLALRVSDANAIFDRLREAGVSLRSKPTTIDEPGPWLGARAFYASDPDGVTVELIEQAESFWPDLARPDRDERA